MTNLVVTMVVLILRFEQIIFQFFHLVVSAHDLPNVQILSWFANWTLKGVISFHIVLETVPVTLCCLFSHTQSSLCDCMLFGLHRIGTEHNNGRRQNSVFTKLQHICNVQTRAMFQMYFQFFFALEPQSPWKNSKVALSISDLQDSTDMPLTSSSACLLASSSSTTLCASDACSWAMVSDCVRICWQTIKNSRFRLAIFPNICQTQEKKSQQTPKHFCFQNSDDWQ